MDLLKPDYITEFTVLGGEPFELRNQRDLLPLIHQIRKTHPKKDIWMFSGFTLEELQTDGSHPRCEYTDELLSLIDILETLIQKHRKIKAFRKRALIFFVKKYKGDYRSVNRNLYVYAN